MEGRRWARTSLRAGPRPAAARAFAGLLIVASLASCTGDGGGAAAPDGATSTTPEAGKLTATRVATLPGMLTSLAAERSDGAVLVGERVGRVWRLVRDPRSGVVERDGSTPVLDISDRVSVTAEQGFFDMALVDDAALVVSYTRLDGAVVVERFDHRPGGGAIDPSSGRTLLALRWNYPWHHGGGMALTREGDLLVGLGDRGLSVPGMPAAQDPTLMIGGVLRIPAAALGATPNGWTASATDMVARGLRNPWRLSVDDRTGDLWIGEVGDLKAEEVDRVPAADLGRRVLNFGWPYLEGSEVVDPRPPADELVAPALQRPHEEGVCGMVGGFVYRGSELPSLRGRYLYADLCEPVLRAAEPQPSGRLKGARSVVESPESLVSIGRDAAGEIYLLGGEGGLYRVGKDVPYADDFDVPPSVVAPSTSSTLPPASVDCGVTEAAYPLLHLSALGPEELRSTLATTISTLRRKVPALPAHLRAAGEAVLATYVAFDARLATFGWDIDSTSPEAVRLRTDIIEGTGDLAGFGSAMATFMGSECR